MSDRYLILDIETIPGEAILAADPPEEWLVKGMGNRKDPVKVEAKRRENAAAWQEESIRRGATDWRHGEIVAIGVLPQDGEPEVFMGPGETTTLRAFWDFFTETRYVPIVGFNLRNFDLPWLRGRSFVRGLRTPSLFLGGRYDTRQVVDWMDVLSHYGAYSWAGWGLDAYVDTFCPDAPPAEGSGADVYGWYLEGATDKIRAHCEADLERTAALHHRAAPAFL